MLSWGGKELSSEKFDVAGAATLNLLHQHQAEEPGEAAWRTTSSLCTGVTWLDAYSEGFAGKGEF